MAQKVEDHPFCYDSYTTTWDKLTIEQAYIDVEWAIKVAKRRIRNIKRVKTPTWKNTFLAHMYMNYELEMAVSRLGLLYKVNNTKEMQKCVSDIIRMISEFNSSVSTDTELYNVLKNAADKIRDKVGADEQWVIDEYIKNVKFSGVHLNDDDKDRLRACSAVLSDLSLKFSNNVFNSKNTLRLTVSDKSELDGLHDETIQEARVQATLDGLGDDKYILPFTDSISYDVMAYARSEKLRRCYYTLVSTIGKCQYSNAYIIQEILKHREIIADILGFKNYAECKTARRMVNSPEKVNEFLNNLEDTLEPSIKRDLKIIRNGNDSIPAHNIAYEMRQLRDAKFKYDIEESRKYFRLEGVLQMLMDIATVVFNVTFVQNYTHPKYHDDVVVYTAMDTRTMKTLGTVYMDLYERKNKSSGAFVSLLRPGVSGKNPRLTERMCKGIGHTNVVALVCNFKRTNGNKGPDHSEIETIFHEFGHLIHMLHSSTKYPTMHSNCVEWDFIEFPSTLMEQFTWLPAVIEEINENSMEYGAEKMPEEIIQNMCSAKKYLHSWITLRQILFAKYDMLIHTLPAKEISDTKSISSIMEKLAEKYNAPIELDSVMNMPHKFTHIFAGGYAAGYYSYLWSEMIAASAFNTFHDAAVAIEKEDGCRTRLRYNGFLKSIWGAVGCAITYDILKKGASAPAEELIKASGIKLNMQHLLKEYDIT